MPYKVYVYFLLISLIMQSRCQVSSNQSLHNDKHGFKYNIRLYFNSILTMTVELNSFRKCIEVEAKKTTKEFENNEFLRAIKVER